VVVAWHSLGTWDWDLSRDSVDSWISGFSNHSSDRKLKRLL